MTSVIDAEEKRDIVPLDIPIAFGQTPIEKSEEKIIMRISGQLAQLLLELKSEKYRKYISYEFSENNNQVIY